jgi:hypothetical protein
LEGIASSCSQGSNFKAGHFDCWLDISHPEKHLSEAASFGLQTARFNVETNG